MHRRFTWPLAVLFVLLSLSPASAEPRSLMSMIVPWQYPGSALTAAEMSDGATVDAAGNRTCQSILCKAVLVTDASVEQVLSFYTSKLKQTTKGEDDTIPPKPSGRSVVFSDDSGDRPFEMHTVLINAVDSSTTLIITRGKQETQTHIAWKQYQRLATER